MKTTDIPFNMKIHFDEDLNEVADDTDQMQQGVNFLKKKFETLNDESVQAAVLLGQIGTFLRVLNEIPESEQTFSHALDIISKHKQPHIKKAIILRMALIDLVKKKFIPANKVFEEALREIKMTGDKRVKQLHDFVLFHYGRSKFAEKSYGEARELLSKALELRLIKGDVDMIEHTQNVLTIINKKF